MVGDGGADQLAHVHSGAGGDVEVLGQVRPVRVLPDVGVEFIYERVPPGLLGTGRTQSVFDLGIEVLLGCAQAVGVLRWSGQAGVVGIDSGGGAVDGHHGDQGVLARPDERAGPCGCVGQCPGAGCGMHL
ncbi:Uncharacterised protein [Mycobacteroides abscessus subsp. massiliense]|nr:Uncharacterised protein [Mycobacteroides abscessus subsp. massiliense]